jgi:hypothetical protein
MFVQSARTVSSLSPKLQVIGHILLQKPEENPCQSGFFSRFPLSWFSIHRARSNNRES